MEPKHSLRVVMNDHMLITENPFKVKHIFFIVTRLVLDIYVKYISFILRID